MRHTTTVTYPGPDIAIIGELDVGLLAIAGCGTLQELAIAAMAVKRRSGRRM